MADGLLDQAKQKADSLKDALDRATPGVDSLREAMKLLGVTSDQTFKDTAEKSKAAYDAMKQSGTASARELSDGFKKYASDAIAANNGVATEALKSEAAMRGIEVQVDSAGKAIVKAMGHGSDSVRGFSRAVGDSLKELQVLDLALDAINSRHGQGKGDLAGKYSRPGEGPNRSVLTKDDMKPVDNTGLYTLEQKRGAGTLSKDDLATAEGAFKAAATNLEVMQKNISGLGLTAIQSIQAEYNASRAILERVKSIDGRPVPTGSGNSTTVNINIGGRSTAVNVASQSDANSLTAVLRQLESGRGVSA